MNYIKTFFSTVFCISVFFTAFSQAVGLYTQADVDAFDKTIVNGHLVIGGTSNNINTDPITNLDALSGLKTVEGVLYIIKNPSLTNIDGLSNLETVGAMMYRETKLYTGHVQIHSNTSLTNLDGLSGLKTINGDLDIQANTALTDCCSIQTLLSTDGAIKRNVVIRDNSTSCDSKATILSTGCSPKEGSEVAESEYKKNLYSLTRWELADCETTVNLKFTKEGKYTKNGGAGGTYTVKDKDLILTPTGGTAQKYTITKMTKNVMHLNDASGNETIYGRKLHLSAQKLAGTNWEDVGVGNADLKFINETEVELINIGGPGVNLTATYVVDNTNKTITFQFSPTVVANNPGLAPSIALDIATFNFMMLKVGTQASGIGCLNRIR